MDEAARKPTSKPISVSPSLRALRVNRPEATRCTRAASARGAGRRHRASGRSTRSARRHEDTEEFKNWAAHISVTFNQYIPVPLRWVKQRASQPQNQSPCPCASARSVLTGRRLRDVPAPPRRVARKGGTSRNREAVPPWMGSSDHTTSLAPSRFSATRRGGAGTSRTYTTQPRSLTGSSRARRPRGPCRAGSRPCRRSSWHTAAASRRLRS